MIATGQQDHRHRNHLVFLAYSTPAKWLGIKSNHRSISSSNYRRVEENIHHHIESTADSCVQAAGRKPLAEVIIWSSTP